MDCSGASASSDAPALASAAAAISKQLLHSLGLGDDSSGADGGVTRRLSFASDDSDATDDEWSSHASSLRLQSSLVPSARKTLPGAEASPNFLPTCKHALQAEPSASGIVVFDDDMPARDSPAGTFPADDFVAMTAAAGPKLDCMDQVVVMLAPANAAPAPLQALRPIDANVVVGTAADGRAKPVTARAEKLSLAPGSAHPADRPPSAWAPGGVRLINEATAPTSTVATAAVAAAAAASPMVESLEGSSSSTTMTASLPQQYPGAGNSALAMMLPSDGSTVSGCGSSNSSSSGSTGVGAVETTNRSDDDDVSTASEAAEARMWKNLKTLKALLDDGFMKPSECVRTAGCSFLLRVRRASPLRIAFRDCWLCFRAASVLCWC
jgi:hypothetical protein